MKLLVRQVRVTLASKPVLQDVCLEVNPGDLVGLVGPNGSGKSTLLRTIYRSLRPDAGAVYVGGDDVWTLSTRAAARRTAAVLQDNPVPAGLSVTEVVGLGRTPHHGLFDREGTQDRQAIDEALARTGMRPLAQRPFVSLSGGERQRVLLACALCQQPQLLVLDEPTNHLDIRARFEILQLVRATGITTLAVLHDLDMAARACDYLVVLHNGQVAAAGRVLQTLTPAVFHDVFGVAATAQRHDDGVVRISFAAQPLAERATARTNP